MIFGKEAMRQAILRELKRQGVEFAKVDATEIAGLLYVLIDGNTRSDHFCVSEQIDPSFNFAPEGMENIRELDLEMMELADAGFIEKSLGGYDLAVNIPE